MVLEHIKSHQSVFDESLNEAGITSVKSNIQKTFTNSEQQSSSNEKADVKLDVEEISEFNSIESKPTLQELFWKYWPKLRPFVHLFLFCFFTAWWISILAQKLHRPHWLIPTFIYGFILLRLIFWQVDSHHVVVLAQKIWNPCVDLLYRLVPPKFRLPGAFLVLIGTHLLLTFVDKPTPNGSRLDKFISFLGYWLCIAIFYASSRDRKHIDWKAVFAGILAQYVLGLFILRTGAGHRLFIFLAKLAQRFLNYAKVGSTFLFNEELLYHSGYFVLNVFPAIMFFSSTVYILSYIGFVQWLVRKVSVLFTWGMNLSGMEAIVAAATPFIGSGEALILMRPYVPFATLAEFHTLNALGFSTISGGAIVSYSALGLNVSALLTAAFMSVPLAIALSRLRFPEREEQVTKGGLDPKEAEQEGQERLFNVIHAFSLGSWTGIMISLAIFTNLLCINATISMIDAILSWFGGYWHIHQLTLEMIIGYLFYPMTFFLGVSRPDIYRISKLLGTKFIYNEYNAYEELLATTNITKRSQMLATFVLCSYANVGTMAEKIAIMVRLAPDRVKAITGTIWSSLMTGFMASFLTACFAGCITVDVDLFSVTAAGAT